ncbi:MAG: hypothetical protein J0J11_09865, partial [Microbacterium sp.]|nr:hypothetical protein [Microbacterium sp.]
SPPQRRPPSPAAASLDRRGSFIHPKIMKFQLNPIQIQAGSGILIEGNRLEDAHNAGVMISQDASRATLSNIVIRDNYLQGGACTINVAPTPKTIRPQVTSNVFGPQRIYATCAITAPNANAPALSGNVWGATGLALTSFIVVP